MAGRLAILCPGQGAQHAEMFAWARADPRTAALLDASDLAAILGSPLDTILADPVLPFSNRIAQPLVVAATLAAWHALRDRLPRPALIAGYSIGEISAYGVAQSMSFNETIRVAARRAELMDQCVKDGPPQSLLAVSGMPLTEVHAVATQFGVHIAIETAEDSAIVGGVHRSIVDFSNVISRAGAHVTPLPVEVASHTPLMQAAVAPFLEELARSEFAAPAIPVLSGISADLVSKKEHAQSSLARQVAEKIEWAACMDACAEQGVTVALEVGPGSDLTRMMQTRHPEIACRSVANFRSIDGVIKWVDASI